MDDMDRMLHRIKASDPPAGLPGRVRQQFHRRRRRRQAAQLALSSVMMLVGAWLFTPWLLYTLGSLNLPQNGLALLQSVLSLPDPGFAVNSTVTGVTQVQTSLAGTLQLNHWFGLLSLSTGSLMGLGSLLAGKII